MALICCLPGTPSALVHVAAFHTLALAQQLELLALLAQACLPCCPILYCSILTCVDANCE